MTERAIATIKLGERFRKELGDIAALAASIRDVGLLHPVVVDERTGELIAGARRLAAYKSLGWERIPVTIISIENWRRAERDENEVRLDLQWSERVAAKRYFEPQMAAEAKEHQRQSKGRGKKVSQVGAPFQTRDRVAKKAGGGRTTLKKAEEVVAAAEANPALTPLVEKMDRTRKVDGVHRELKQKQDEQRRVAVKPIEGKYRTIVIDPPWDHEGLSVAGRGKPEYAVMNMAQLTALPVSEWADDECHLYLWTTNNFILRAGELIAAWGFDYKTVITWVKPRFGLGSYFRSSTEHCLFAVKGKAPTRARNIPTHFEAPLGKHSEKPQALYGIAERASYPPRLDVFARRKRDGWTVWGAGL